jgi:hypothetical protein
MPMVQNAGGYFNTLLRGDRAAMSQATAGPAAQITDQYRGANSSLEHMGIRGGEAATSRAELARDQAAKVAGLTTGVQPMAAGALASLGMNQTEQGQRGVAAAGEGFGNLMRTRLASQDQSFKQNEGVASGFGKGISEILKPGVFHKGGGGVSPGTQVTPIDPNYGGETYP